MIVSEKEEGFETDLLLFLFVDLSIIEETRGVNSRFARRDFSRSRFPNASAPSNTFIPDFQFSSLFRSKSLGSICRWSSKLIPSRATAEEASPAKIARISFESLRESGVLNILRTVWPEEDFS